MQGVDGAGHVDHPAPLLAKSRVPWGGRQPRVGVQIGKVARYRGALGHDFAISHIERRDLPHRVHRRGAIPRFLLGSGCAFDQRIRKAEQR